MEETVCGPVQERFAFFQWRLVANQSDSPALENDNLTAISFRTRDGRLLRGYKLSAYSNKSAPAYVLVAQGNAANANYITFFSEFAQAGFDVFMYSYRGYGDSEGRSRLKAIRSDYIELIGSLNATHERRFLLGQSFGGIIMMNAIGAGVDYSAAFIDSSPARISGYGCPEKFDPIANVPQNTSRIAVLASTNDPVIPGKDSLPLLEAVKRQGGSGFIVPHPSHLVGSASENRERKSMILRFFSNFP